MSEAYILQACLLLRAVPGTGQATSPSFPQDERRGLVHADRTGSGQRRFRRDVLRRLAFIRIAQRVGLTLEEIVSALAVLPVGQPR